MSAPRPRLELITRLAALADEQPDAPAVVTLGRCASAQRQMTYGALADAALACALRLDSERPEGGSPVVILCGPNSGEYVAALLGVIAAGMAVFPVHAGLAEPELHAAVHACGAWAAVAGGPALQVLRAAGLPVFNLDSVGGAAPHALPAWNDFDQRGSALLLQTSATTGRPRIARRPGPAIDAVARNVARSVAMRRGDRILAAIPMSHAYGVENALLAPVFAGSCVLACDGFHPAVVAEALGRQGATIFPGVPFMYQALADLGVPRPATLRCAYCAGRLPASVAEAFRRVTGITVGQLYGATELGSVTFNHPDDPDFDPGSVGRPMERVEIRIVDGDDPDSALPPGAEGQVAVRAPTMLDGYVDGGGAALAKGFFLTGDLGRLDPAGRLTITGRIKLQIEVGGLKVNPLEVERVLAAHPGVRECAVVALRLTESVNRLKAVVVPRPGCTAGPRELRQFARERLAAHKVPRVIEIRESLPRSATGKVQRQALLEP